MNMKYGFMKVASAIPAVRVGDVIFNTQKIEEQIILAEGKGVEVITFLNFRSRDIPVRTFSASKSCWRQRNRA